MLFRYLFTLIFALSSSCFAATFSVTSTSCEGAGSLREAVASANANPGTDTINIQNGLNINLWSCTKPANVNFTDWYAITVTESVNILGNGATLDGQLTWINTSGAVRPKNVCPYSNGSTIIITPAPKFMQVGSFAGGATGIEVGLSNITVKNLQQFTRVRTNGVLRVTNAQVSDMNDIFSCTEGAVVGETGSLIDIRDSQFRFNWANNLVNIPGATIFGNQVVLHGVILDTNKAGAAVMADGTSHIVSSRIISSGGITALSATVNVVNTSIVRQTTSLSIWDKIAASGAGARLNFIASTYSQLVDGCVFQLQPCPPSTVVAQNGGVVNMEGSAVGVGTPSGSTMNLIGAESGGILQSDAFTWIQPTAAQNAAAINALLPNALTATPGLPTDATGLTGISEELLVPVNPGTLINAISDSACPAGGNRLLDPIDGSCITVDVLGKPRVDALGRRTIGAIQIGETPHLFVTATGDTTISLYWVPTFNTATLDGYAVTYRPLGSAGAFTRVAVVGGVNLSATLTGLTNGVTYEIYVTPVQGGSDLVGLVSNQAQATPYASTVAGPVPSGALNGPATVWLSWTEPDLGGHPGPAYYTVMYRPVGATNWTAGPSFLSGRVTAISGLASATQYEFAVLATATDGFVTEIGTTTVTTGPAGTVSIPTLSEFGFVLLALLMLGAALMRWPGHGAKRERIR